MPNQRITYASTAYRYELNPTRLFEVLADMGNCLELLVSQAQEDNPGAVAPFCGLRGERDRRTLTLRTEVVDEPGILGSFDLAQLYFGRNNHRLTFTINAHPRVAIPSDYLHSIGRKWLAIPSPVTEFISP